MFPTKNDPKRQKHSIKDSLANVSKEQHPCPVKSNWKPLYWYVYEGHGDTKSKDNSMEEKEHTTKSGKQNTNVEITFSRKVATLAIKVKPIPIIRPVN